MTNRTPARDRSAAMGVAEKVRITALRPGNSGGGKGLSVSRQTQQVVRDLEIG